MSGAIRFGFDRLIAHAGATRRLSVGTIAGSCTVSNAERTRGSACIAERRVIETIDLGSTATPSMKFGALVRMDARWQDRLVFGAIEQRVVMATPSPR